MVEESRAAQPGEARVSTGNASLDAMLEGGLVAHRPYLVVGPSGTGKTTLSIQFLCDGVRRGERVLLVTLEEPPNEARINHRGLEPELSRVEVFDAIPDIMRYERTPFKDIASVRAALPFSRVPWRIRQSPELASVEVTITALEQMLRTEVIRKGYSRIVIDSLTALQYFCMKGFDPVAGAQSFLRFLSDLRVTTILTVEAPLEEVESPERSLARGEIRLFRWELDGRTVRAIGVEKFRGSSHDVRLHPYRIGPQGIGIDLETTISRDTRQIIEPIVRPLAPPATAAPIPPVVSSVTPLIDEMRDLVLIGADVAPARAEIVAALAATNDGQLDQARAHLSRVSSLVTVLVDQLSRGPRPVPPTDPEAAGALQRVLARADTIRTGVPPTSLPPVTVLQVQLGALLSLLPSPPVVPPPPPPVAPPAPTLAPPAPAAPVPAPPSPEVVPPPQSPEASTPVASALEGRAAPTEAPTEAPARPKARRVLPAPPAPRPPVSAPRGPKPSPAPSPRPSSKKAEPPPLPRKAMPEWLVPPVLPSPTPAAPLSTGRPTPHPAPPAPAAPRAPAGAAKRRRKAPSGAPGKKLSTAARAAAHEPPSIAAPPAPPAPIEAPAPTPSGAAPGHREAVSVPKSRRRTARKRKAPPVVSVEVEPIPPGVFGASDDPSPSSDPSDPADPPAPASPPEG